LKKLIILLFIFISTNIFGLDLYLFDSEGLFLKKKQAKESPREPGVYLENPNKNTRIAPPLASVNEVAKFDKQSQTWSIIPDFRGTTYYLKENGNAFKINKANVLVPENSVTIPPIGFEKPEWIDGQWIETAIILTPKEKAKKLKLKNLLTQDNLYEILKQVIELSKNGSVSNEFQKIIDKVAIIEGE
jgi:hypothetical protein